MFDKRAEAEGADQIRSQFAFTVPDNSGCGQKVRPFRDPIALGVLVKVVERLRADGLRVTDAKPGMACHAAFSVKFPEFEVLVILLARRRDGIVDCRILSWCARSPWRRPSPRVVSEGWSRACVAIKKALSQDPDTASLRWMTEDESRVQDRSAAENFESRLVRSGTSTTNG
jgi:hypothetical protein